MVNLKPAYDAAVAADAKVNAVLMQMSAALEKGTDEGKQEALDLRPALDAAKAEAVQANDLYVAMRGASAGVDDNARRFVPVNEAAAAAGVVTKQMTRAEWEKLDFEARRQFFKDGGELVENQA